MQTQVVPMSTTGKKAHHRPASHGKFKFAYARPQARQTADEKHRQLSDATQKWVSQTFFGQLLKQMRDSPFKSKLFDGGRGGEMFQAMADQRTADSMARGTGHKLVDAIVDRIEHRAAQGSTAGTDTTGGRDWGHA